MAVPRLRYVLATGPPSISISLPTSRWARRPCRAALPFIAGAPVLQDQPDTFTVVVSEGEAQAGHVKLSFFGGIGSDVSENRKRRKTVSCGWHRWPI